jgi:circadian clock protein KaiB
MTEKYILKLYIVGSNSASELALRNLREIISHESETIFDLEVIDVRKFPQLAEDARILAVPTLIKKLPKPMRKIIGDLSNKQKVLHSLDLISKG